MYYKFQLIAIYLHCWMIDLATLFHSKNTNITLSDILIGFHDSKGWSSMVHMRGNNLAVTSYLIGYLVSLAIEKHVTFFHLSGQPDKTCRMTIQETIDTPSYQNASSSVLEIRIEEKWVVKWEHTIKVSNAKWFFYIERAMFDMIKWWHGD